IAMKIKAMKIELRDAPPCTLATTVLYRELPQLQEAGVVFWGKGDPRPRPSFDKRRNLPPKSLTPGKTPPPEGARSTAPSSPSAPTNGPSSTETVKFSDGFEVNPVPGPDWIAGDSSSASGFDYWGDLTSGCARVRSGIWSASCSGHGDAP